MNSSGIFSFEGLVPVIDPAAFVHPAATLIGDVVIGPRCYIGPGAVLRGDFARLVVEAGSNVQDNCVVHTFPGCEVVIASDAHIGHGAVLHGCQLARNVLIGIKSVVLDGATIGENAFVAAAALVPAGFAVPPDSLVAGVPAKVRRTLTAEEIARKVANTRTDQDLAARSLRAMQPCAPLRRIEPGRPRLPDDLGIAPQSG